MDRLTEAELLRIRADHAGHGCDTAALLAELDQRNAAVRAWQGRRHQLGPVPHLAQFSGRPDPWQPDQDAAIAMGQLGPTSAGELCP